MKNFYRAAAVFFLLILSFPLNARVSADVPAEEEAEIDLSEKKSIFSLSVEPLFGFKNGSLGEYVFLYEPAFESPLLSYLDWQIKKEFFAGANLSFGIKDFFLTGDFKAAVPLNCGIMTDSDWRNNEKLSLDTSYDYKTHYSEHTSVLKYDFEFRAKAGWDFKFAKKFKIMPTLGISYSKIKLAGKDGWVNYGYSISNPGYDYPPFYPFDDEEESHVKKDSLSGDVIYYTRENTSFFVGLNFAFLPVENLLLAVGFEAMPFTYTFNLDNHLLTSTDFVDICQGSFKEFKITARAEYCFTKNLSAALNFAYDRLILLTGTNYSKDASEAYYNKSPYVYGGADSSALEFSLSCRYKFF